MESTILQSLETEKMSEIDSFTRSIMSGRRARRRYERSFVRARERLALLSSIKSLGFWTWDRETDVAWASKHARSVLGLAARGPLTRDTLLAVIHPVDRAAVLHAFGRATCQTDTVEMELRVMSQEHPTRWVTAKASAY